MYFPENLLTKDGAWKILNINGDKLEIERNIRFSNSGDKEKIIKLKNNSKINQ